MAAPPAYSAVYRAPAGAPGAYPPHSAGMGPPPAGYGAPGPAYGGAPPPGYGSYSMAPTSTAPSGGASWGGAAPHGAPGAGAGAPPGAGAGAGADTTSYSVGMDPSFDVTSEMRAYSGPDERRRFEALADLYEVIKCTEHLETAYVRDSIGQDAYTTACNKLISQFKTAERTVVGNGYAKDTRSFIHDYGLRCERAVERLLVAGVPATVMHRTSDGRGASVHVAETVQYFITAMDALEISQRAVDQLQPLLMDVMAGLNKNEALPADFAGKTKVQHWLVTLNEMRASDEIDDDQARQLMFDLRSAYDSFHRFLSDGHK